VRKFFLALFFGALASLLWYPLGFVVFALALIALLFVPGTCPYCGKLVKLGAPACSHCGRFVRG
jgi:hypothetical protein